jgi:hypothetical protein
LHHSEINVDHQFSTHQAESVSKSGALLHHMLDEHAISAIFTDVAPVCFVRSHIVLKIVSLAFDTMIVFLPCLILIFNSLVVAPKQLSPCYLHSKPYAHLNSNSSQVFIIFLENLFCAQCTATRAMPRLLVVAEHPPPWNGPTAEHIAQVTELYESAPFMLASDRDIFEIPIKQRQLQSKSTLRVFYTWAQPGVVKVSIAKALEMGEHFRTIDQYFRPPIPHAIFDIIL